MSRPPKSLDDFKIQARILLKALRSDDSTQVSSAVERFRAWPPLKRLSMTQFIGANSRIRLKHALAVVAIEAGHDSWASLKNATERLADPNDRLCPKRPGGFLNAWFSSYDEARACREEGGGYLLPYRSQFFVCGATYIAEALKLAPDDEDWARIGWDWARPRDPEAWKRLSAKLG